jgi:CBS domain-containing protein
VNGLGRPVRELVTRPTVAVSLDATLREVAAVLAGDFVGAVVVEGVGRSAMGSATVGGIISERDIFRALAEGADPDRERARDVMTADLAVAAPTESVQRVAEQMLADEIRHLPLLRDGAVVGVVSERDVLRSVLDDLRTSGV